MGNELNAIKTDLRNQYEDQLAANRPKGSRNVLNNKQVKKSESSSQHSSRQESDSDDDGGVDHTYNPYSFKKIE